MDDPTQLVPDLFHHRCGDMEGHDTPVAGTTPTSGWTARAATRAGHSPIGPEDLARLRSVAADHEVAAGDRLFRSGDAVDRVLVVGSAEVELRARLREGRQVMHIVREGGVIADLRDDGLIGSSDRETVLRDIDALHEIAAPSLPS